MSIVTAEAVEGIHPLGEGVFSFPTAGGRVRLSVTDDALTPYGGLVPWAAFTKHIGIVENLAANCPVKRTSPNAAPVYDVIQSFMLTALTDGRGVDQSTGSAFVARLTRTDYPGLGFDGAH